MGRARWLKLGLGTTALMLAMTGAACASCAPGKTAPLQLVAYTYSYPQMVVKLRNIGKAPIASFKGALHASYEISGKAVSSTVKLKPQVDLPKGASREQTVGAKLWRNSDALEGKLKKPQLELCIEAVTFADGSQVTF